MSQPLWQLSASETARRIREWDVTAVEVIAAHLARLDEANPGVNVVTAECAEEAMAAAAHADRISSGSTLLGPLHGVPVTIKENIDVTGQVTPNGLPGLADTVATEDSPPVANLRKAGAIVIGRTNTPEFSYRWHTDNPLRGATKNPWDQTRTPGGSSGGAAASLALGIGSIAYGNDLGGSLRYPAYCCGLSTVRPTLGRVPAYNGTALAERSMALQLMSVQGPIAREVRDVRLALEVMSAPDWRDPWQVPAPLAGPSVRSPIRVALTRGPKSSSLVPEVNTALDVGAEYLADAGYEIVETDPPDLDEMRDAWLKILMTETRNSPMWSTMQELGSDAIRMAMDVFVDLAGPVDLAAYIDLLARRNAHLRSWIHFLEDHPIILSPVSQELPILAGEDVSSAARLTEIVAAQTMLVAINYLGLPASVVPSCFTAGGLPVGVQLIGGRFREDLCLDAAEAIENRAGVATHELWDR